MSLSPGLAALLDRVAAEYDAARSRRYCRECGHGVLTGDVVHTYCASDFAFAEAERARG